MPVVIYAALIALASTLIALGLLVPAILAALGAAALYVRAYVKSALEPLGEPRRGFLG